MRKLKCLCIYLQATEIQPASRRNGRLLVEIESLQRNYWNVLKV